MYVETSHFIYLIFTVGNFQKISQSLVILVLHNYY